MSNAKNSLGPVARERCPPLIDVTSRMTAQRAGPSGEAAQAEPRLAFSFDSSGWLHIYHLGVAHALQNHLLPVAGTHKFAFSGSSGGALVAASLCTELPIGTLAAHVISRQSECEFNPWRMLPCAEEAMARFLPPDAHVRCTGRLRVLLTRVEVAWLKPLFRPETYNAFDSRRNLEQVLRASCHIPIIGGILPYTIDGGGARGAFYDGLFWPSILHMWRAGSGDTLVKVSGIGSLTAHIRPPLPPPPHWCVRSPTLLKRRALAHACLLRQVRPPAFASDALAPLRDGRGRRRREAAPLARQG